MRFIQKWTPWCLLLWSIVMVAQPAFSITIAEEEELGREFMKMLRQELKIIEDPTIEAYVNKVGHRILAAVPPQPFRYQFYVVDEYVYNAFATPGGNIFINRGLFSALDNEDELAGILAHEIGHVTARHISDKIERSKKIGAATLAGVIAGAFLGSTAGSAAAQALTIGSVAASQAATLAFSRQDEMQADQLGLDYLHKAGYSARGLLESLQIIRGKQWFGDIPNYLSTHPASADRMAYIDTWIEANDAPTRDVDPLAFQKIKIRLDALYGEPEIVAQEFNRKLSETPEDPVLLYGEGLLQARLGRRADALTLLKKALSKSPLDPDFITSLGKIYYQDGQYAEALSTLEGAENLPPYDPERALYLGQARMQTGQLAKAVSTLETLVSERPEYTAAYYALGEVYSRLGDEGSAHYFLGIYYYYKGNLRNAFFHLRKADQTVSDPEKKTRIRDLLEELKPTEKKGPPQ